MMQIPGKNVRKRKRTKKLLKDIKEQIEFYLSDANLVRDKFLLEYVGPEGNNFVPIEIFTDFNRLKEMGATQSLIQNAVKTSNKLQLSEDKTLFKRKVNFLQRPSSENDLSTIYIDGLPPGATVHWLKDICHKLGPVRYISLPCFKSGIIKGFAFIEFVNANEAICACELLNSPPKSFFPKLPLTNRNKQAKNNLVTSESFCSVEVDGYSGKPLDQNNSETLVHGVDHPRNHEKKSLLSFQQGCKQTDSLKVEVDHPGNYSSVSPNVPSIKSKVVCSGVSNKRKRSAEKTLESQDAPSRKHFKEAQVSLKECETTVMSDGKEFEVRDADNLLLDQTTVKQKHKRRRKQRVREKNTNSATIKIPFQLHAIPKSEWLELKRSYLREQRCDMGKLKSVLQKCLADDSQATSGYIKRHIALNEEIIDANDETSNQQTTNNQETHSGVKIVKRSNSTPHFIPGVIACLSSLTKSFSSKEMAPLPSYQVIKEHFAQYGEVSYVDVKPGSHQGHIRFRDTDSAQRAILENKRFGLCLLTGEAEENYWDALLVSRQLKRSRERPRVRGCQKLVNRAEQMIERSSKKHIKFNADF